MVTVAGGDHSGYFPIRYQMPFEVVSSVMGGLDLPVNECAVKMVYIGFTQ